MMNNLVKIFKGNTLWKHSYKDSLSTPVNKLLYLLTGWLALPTFIHILTYSIPQLTVMSLSANFGQY